MVYIYSRIENGNMIMFFSLRLNIIIAFFTKIVLSVVDGIIFINVKTYHFIS